jgi:hypothetical protein
VEYTKSSDLDFSLRQSRRRWRRDVEIIRKVFKLQKELERVPELLDVYCSCKPGLRFTKDEISSSTLDQTLRWLGAAGNGLELVRKKRMDIEKEVVAA